MADEAGSVRRGMGKGRGAIAPVGPLGWAECDNYPRMAGRRGTPGRFSKFQLRTLQRRIRDYRALYGPDREVYFQQEHPPGREAQVDFTHCTELGVTIGGEPFRHLLFHFVLSHSGWSYAEVSFGETFGALVKGLQGVLWELRGVTRLVRTGNLSAATHELRTAGDGPRTPGMRLFWPTTDWRRLGPTLAPPTRTE